MTRARKTEDPPASAEFAERADAARLSPLWTFFKDWFAAEPSGAALPHLWSFDSLRALIMDSASIVSTADAERRVLALENPGLRGRHLATDSLYAGVQLIMPGEIARAHRHTAAALRFIIEGSGTYTAVEGEKCYMEPGDLIVTPSWSWHEHRNESAAPTFWLDVLDVALVRFLGAGFSEQYPEPSFPEHVARGDAHFPSSPNLLPVDYERRGARDRDRAGASRRFSYPYAHARSTLERSKQQGEYDPCHGIRMQYVDPTTGGPAIPTISTFLQLLPRGFATEPYAATSSSLLCVVEGQGRATIGRGSGARIVPYAPRDLLVVPSWQPLSLAADEDSLLFSASDEAVQRKLGVWRERRGV